MWNTDEEILTVVNENTWGKTKCLTVSWFNKNSTWTGMESNPFFCVKSLASNGLSDVTALSSHKHKVDILKYMYITDRYVSYINTFEYVKVLSLTQENANDPHSAGTVPNTHDDNRGKNIQYSQKHEFLSLNDLLSIGRHLVGVLFIQSVQSI